MSAPLRPRAVRGAITVSHDTPEAIASATGKLLAALLDVNDLALADVTSAYFPATPDLRSDFPAKGARSAGWDEIPMLCAQEIDVDGALPRCVRVLLHLHLPADLPLRPVYLGGARTLRPDLATAQRA